MLGKIVNSQVKSRIGKTIEFTLDDDNIYVIPCTNGMTSVYTHIKKGDGGIILPTKDIELKSAQSLQETILIQNLLDRINETKICLIPENPYEKNKFYREKTFIFYGETLKSLEEISSLERTLRTLIYPIIEEDENISKIIYEYIEENGKVYFKTTHSRLRFSEEEKPIWLWNEMQ